MKNELIQKWETDVIKLTDEAYERYERMLADIEWFDTLKYKFKEFAKETGISKWVTDAWTMNYIVTKPGKRIDTDRMKKENIMVVNAETGEIEEVNAYDYFCTKYTVSSPYVKVSENKG